MLAWNYHQNIFSFLILKLARKRVLKKLFDSIQSFFTLKKTATCFWTFKPFQAFSRFKSIKIWFTFPSKLISTSKEQVCVKKKFLLISRRCWYFSFVFIDKINEKSMEMWVFLHLTIAKIVFMAKQFQSYSSNLDWNIHENIWRCC